MGPRLYVKPTQCALKVFLACGLRLRAPAEATPNQPGFMYAPDRLLGRPT